MTKQELVKAFEMKVDGFTYEEIGNHYGLSKQRIEQLLKSILVRKVTESKYPNLSLWIFERYKSYHAFCSSCGFTEVTFRQVMKGQKSPNMTTIKKLIEVTGMSFEELFSEKEK
jgi:transcriptional regulator with XRE-family HTH domain